VTPSVAAQATSDSIQSPSTYKKRPATPLEIFSLESRLQMYINIERLAKCKTYWALDPSLLRNQSVSLKTFEFFESCGSHVEHLYWMGSPGTPSSTVTSILNPLLQFAKNITKISFRYNTLPDITHFLTKIIKPNLINGNLKNLNSFRLTSVSGDGKLTKPILQAIKETQIKWN